ncbi:RRP15-like protein [Parasteatoda tepidariorum]|uniref:RRP15-like protein n=1 Tax=Parasteatoda tepidariorum TaxID=114398 RepID=UPI00077FB15A|nr:RRP15-like protein [Parasteatoda tepidariorum]XP_015923555.1 RRP15-like protein [Parasteatoda tepidariorum]
MMELETKESGDEMDADIESGGESLSDDELLGDDDDNNRNVSGNMAWAKAMQNVLSTTPRTENFILSKAKRDSDIKKKKVKDIEFVDSSGKVVEQDSQVKQEKSYKEMRRAKLDNQKKKAEWEAMCRVKPDVTKKEKEKEFIKIATRGVVHLFNAVGDHQKTVKNNKKSARKNEKINVVKGTFMDILKQHSKQDKKAESEVEKAKKEETWSILKDDFMMGAEMKDWDKESDDET